MAWLMAKIYDRFMKQTEEACLSRWRTELLAEASGRVLEVGSGTGVNIPLYPAHVRELTATEPDPHMRRQLERKYSNRPGLVIGSDPVGALSYADSSFDTIVSTLVLCSVQDLAAALLDLRRVLKPGGRLLFIEHVAAQAHPSRLRWQRRVEPLWKRVAGNCHVTRDTEAAIQTAGFVIDRLQRESIRKALPWVRPSIRGIAHRS